LARGAAPVRFLVILVYSRVCAHRWPEAVLESAENENENIIIFYIVTNKNIIKNHISGSVSTAAPPQCLGASEVLRKLSAAMGDDQCGMLGLP
jgi:hypothetical protein